MIDFRTMSKDSDKNPCQIRSETKKKSLEATEGAAYDQDVITHPGPHDVLMGRGAPSTDYSGNLRFRELVKERRNDYVNAKRRKDKQGVAGEIIATIRNRGGRFLERVETYRKTNDAGESKKLSIWHPVTDRKTLLVKVKQLMRDVGPAAQEKRNLRREQRRQQELQAISKGPCLARRQEAPAEEKSGTSSPKAIYDSSEHTLREQLPSFRFGQDQQSSDLLRSQNYPVSMLSGGTNVALNSTINGGDFRVQMQAAARDEALLRERLRQDITLREVARLRQQIQQQQQAVNTQTLLRYAQQQNVVGPSVPSLGFSHFSAPQDQESAMAAALRREESAMAAALQRDQLIRSLRSQNPMSYGNPNQGVIPSSNFGPQFPAPAPLNSSTDAALYAAYLRQQSERSASDSETSRRFP